MKIQRLLKSVFLILLCALTALSIASCDDGEASETETDAITEARELISLDGYTFVYSASSSREVISAVREAVDTFAAMGAKLSHTNDWMAIAPEEPIRNEDLEILVGATNRAESEEAKSSIKGNFTFSITHIGSKVVILGGSEEALLRGIEYFTELIKSEGSVVIEKDYTYSMNYVNEAVSADSVIAQLAAEYTIVFPVISNLGEKTIADEIAEAIFTRTDTNPKRRNDNSQSVGKEILIGSTSRSPENIECGYFDYSIKIEGDKIFLIGSNRATLSMAGTKLIELALSDELKLDSDNEYKYSILKKEDMNPIVNDISSFTPFWATSYTPPAWMLDFDEKTYAVTCPDGRITIKAHRGDSDNYPENSIECIASAILAGADCVEIDTQVTRDGIIVLMHDSTLTKTTNVTDFVGKSGYPKTLAVADWTYEQLCSLRLKSKGGNLTDYKIPTLYEALALCADRVFVQIDDKSGYVDVNSKEIYALARETGSEKCFFYYYGVSLLSKWAGYDSDNKELASYIATCRSYLSISGHSLRKPYWTNEVNKYDGGQFSETVDWWKKLSSEGKLMIWSQNVWKLSQYVSQNYTAATPK